MKIDSLLWLPEIIDKLDWKHHVSTDEVEAFFQNAPIFRKIQKGHVAGEDLYVGLGRTNAGRYLSVFFIYKSSHEALIISARDMDKKERGYYAKR
jgi:uncharacterized DUF497 family protein